MTQIPMAQPTLPTYSPQTQEALETMAARILLSVGVIQSQITALLRMLTLVLSLNLLLQNVPQAAGQTGLCPIQCGVCL